MEIEEIRTALQVARSQDANVIRNWIADKGYSSRVGESDLYELSQRLIQILWLELAPPPGPVDPPRPPDRRFA